MDTRQVRNTLLLVLTTLIWGCTFVVQSLGAEYVEASTLLALRHWIGGFVLLPVIALMDAYGRRKGNPPTAPQTREEKRTLLIGGIACGFFLCLAATTQQIGISQTTTAQ